METMDLGIAIDGSRDKALERDKKERGGNELQIYTDGSGEHTVYESEAVAMALGLHLAKEFGARDGVRMALDNQAAATAAARVKPRPGAMVMVEVEKAAREVKRQVRERKAVMLRWVPGHEGADGNEAADEEAKKAAKGETSAREELPEFLRRNPRDTRS